MVFCSLFFVVFFVWVFLFVVCLFVFGAVGVYMCSQNKGRWGCVGVVVCCCSSLVWGARCGGSGGGLGLGRDGAGVEGWRVPSSGGGAGMTGTGVNVTGCVGDVWID